MLEYIALSVVVCLFNSVLADIDCSRPPPFVNPHACCQDTEPNEITINCAQTVGFPLPNQQNASPSAQPKPPSIQTAACFADCVMRDSRYLSNGNLDSQTIRNDIQQRFAGDDEYVAVMTAGFEKCGPVAQQRMNMLQNSPMAKEFVQSCSPFAGLLLGCVYMEYFQNCPATKWKNSNECNNLRAFVTACSNRRPT